MSQLVTLLVDFKTISVLFHMGDFGYGDGGWTLAMKIDGNKVNCMSYKRFFSTSITSLNIERFKLNSAALMFLIKTGVYDLF